MNRFKYIAGSKKSLVRTGESWKHKTLGTEVQIDKISDIGLVYWRSSYKTGVMELNPFVENHVRKWC